MAEAEIFHRLHSHAAGWQEVRFDERDAADVLPREALRELDALMTKATPSSDAPAWVVTRFAAGSDTYACVIVSYRDLILDRGGRAGLLTHARLVRVASEEAWLDAAALVALAEGFAAEDVRRTVAERRLQRYVDLTSAEDAIVLRPVTLADLDLPRPFLRDALVGCLAALGRREETRIAVGPPQRSLAGDLALACAALPVALQRTSTWAVGVESGCPVDAIFGTSAGKPATAVGSRTLVDFVTRYLTLLLDSAHDFSSVLRNPDINTITRLNDAVQKAEPLAYVRTEMPKKKDPDEGSDTNAELDRQYRAMEASLRTYIDQRFAAMEARAPQRESMTNAWTPPRVLAVVAMLIVTAGLTFALTRYFGDRNVPPPNDGTTIPYVEPATAPATTTEIVENDPAADEHRAALQKAIDAASADGKWAEGLKALLETNGAIVAGAMRKSAPPDVRISGEMEDIAGKIDTKTLPSRDRLRTLLVDVINARKVDGRLDDVELDRLKREYGVTGKARDAANIDLQSEIILRWLAKETR